MLYLCLCLGSSSLFEEQVMYITFICVLLILLIYCSKEKLDIIENLKNEKNKAEVENEAIQQVSSVTLSTFIYVNVT